MMLASHIRNEGRFDITYNPSVELKSYTDGELVDMLGMELPQTNNDIINNVFGNIEHEHPRNPFADKFWRGDILDCYAMLKNMVYVHIFAATIKSPEKFGWAAKDWDEIKSGRQLLEDYTEYKIFRESFLCETEHDMGYLYQKLMGIIFPQPSTPLTSVPICKFEFRR